MASAYGPYVPHELHQKLWDLLSTSKWDLGFYILISPDVQRVGEGICWSCILLLLEIVSMAPGQVTTATFPQQLLAGMCKSQPQDKSHRLRETPNPASIQAALQESLK
jgi:hypothetical protein